MVAPYYEAERASKASDALLEAIEAKAKVDGQSVSNLLRLAEAYAWIVAPDSPHGGSNATSPK